MAWGIGLNDRGVSFDIEWVPTDKVFPGDRDDRWLYARADLSQPLVCADLDKAAPSDT